MISLAKGAETSLFLATAPEVAAVSGGLLRQEKGGAREAFLQHARHMPASLWELSEQLTSTAFLA